MTSFAQAQGSAAAQVGSIAGAADPGSQIIVTGMGDNHQVIGVVGKKDGTYRVERLPPGRYLIKEQGLRHVARELAVTAGQVAQVDLKPAR
ncbi:MAG: carboxypeptidase-like regulatory domain-containing protein [Caulobacteraceae bacterium]